MARNIREAGFPKEVAIGLMRSALLDPRASLDVDRPWTAGDVEKLVSEAYKGPAPDQRHYLKADLARVDELVALGGEFILDVPTELPAVWGSGQRVAWVEDEPIMLVGGEGLGKSTLAQQLLLARIGVRGSTFLGLPVAASERPALYLALDRPQQIARSFHRMVSEVIGVFWTSGCASGAGRSRSISASRRMHCCGSWTRSGPGISTSTR